MDFNFTKKEEAFRQNLRTWLSDNLPEGWLEGKRDLPEDGEEYSTFLRKWQKTLYQGGWSAIAWPKEYGGKDATLMEEIIYHQEMVQVEAPPLINYIGIHMVAPTLMDLGTEEQKKNIEKILTGEQVWSQGYSEPNAGSDLNGVSTSAIKDGDRWLINGQKVWTSYAHVADYCFLLTKTGKKGERHGGITVFLLDMNQPGVETRPIIQMDGQSEFNEVYLTDAIAYDEDIVGKVDDGWKVLIALMLHERTGIAAQAFSLEKKFNELVEMIKERKIDNKSLMEDSLVRQKMADFYSRTRGALLNYYRNLTQTIKNGKPGPENSIDKLVVSELGKEIDAFTMSVLGHEGVLYSKKSSGRGYGSSYQSGFLASFGSTIGGGTSEIQRNTIGERLLGLPKDMGR